MAKRKLTGVKGGIKIQKDESIVLTPSNGEPGDIALDPSSNQVKIWTNSGWQPINGIPTVVSEMPSNTISSSLDKFNANNSKYTAYPESHLFDNGRSLNPLNNIKLFNLKSIDQNSAHAFVSLNAVPLLKDDPLMDSTTNWAVVQGASGLSLNSTNKIIGNNSLSFNKTVTTNDHAGIRYDFPATLLDLLDYKRYSCTFYMFIPNASLVQSVYVRVYDRWNTASFGTFYINKDIDGNPIQNGWNLFHLVLSFPFYGSSHPSGITVTTTTDYIQTGFIEFGVRTVATSTTLSGILLDAAYLHSGTFTAHLNFDYLIKNREFVSSLISTTLNYRRIIKILNVQDLPFYSFLSSNSEIISTQGLILKAIIDANQLSSSDSIPVGHILKYSDYNSFAGQLVIDNMANNAISSTSSSAHYKTILRRDNSNNENYQINVGIMPSNCLLIYNLDKPNKTIDIPVIYDNVSQADRITYFSNPNNAKLDVFKKYNIGICSQLKYLTTLTITNVTSNPQGRIRLQVAENINDLDTECFVVVRNHKVFLSNNNINQLDDFNIPEMIINKIDIKHQGIMPPNYNYCILHDSGFDLPPSVPSTTVYTMTHNSLGFLPNRQISFTNHLGYSNYDTVYGFTKFSPNGKYIFNPENTNFSSNPVKLVRSGVIQNDAILNSLLGTYEPVQLSFWFYGDNRIIVHNIIQSLIAASTGNVGWGIELYPDNLNTLYFAFYGHARYSLGSYALNKWNFIYVYIDRSREINIFFNGRWFSFRTNGFLSGGWPTVNVGATIDFGYGAYNSDNNLGLRNTQITDLYVTLGGERWTHDQILAMYNDGIYRPLIVPTIEYSYDLLNFDKDAIKVKVELPLENRGYNNLLDYVEIVKKS